MIKGKTKSGFRYEVDGNVAKDARFMKMVTLFQSKKERDAERAESFFETVDVVLGVDGAERLLKHVEGKNGVAPLDKVSREFFEIVQHVIEQDATAKKSMPLPE